MLKNRAFVLGLEGDLGGGKTTFTQGFAKGLGIKEKILSPTFLILRHFSIQKSVFENFYHIDCYRITNFREILTFGFRKIISNPKHIVVVEWAERIRKTIPKNTQRIRFEFLSKRKRRIKILSDF